MTPKQAADGLIELVLPEDRRILVDFRDRAAGDPDIEAELVQTVLAAEDADADIYAAVEAYASARGLTASFFLGGADSILTIGSAESNPKNRRARAASQFDG